MEENLLDKLAVKYGTDKQSSMHGYTNYYKFYFDPIRQNVKKVLEFGVLSGASLRMWRDYFPNAVIHGIDINSKCIRQQSERIKITIGNLNDPAFVASFIAQNGDDFDIMVDDASHINKEQIGTFNMFFPHLKSKGIYVIEDTNTSYYKEYGGGYKRADSTIEFFKERIDDVLLKGCRLYGRRVNTYAGRNFLLPLKIRDYTEYEKSMESIHFYSGLIIILKQ